MKYRNFLEIFESVNGKHFLIKWALFLLCNLFIGFVYFAFLSFAAHAKNNNRYPASKYKKVVKEGLFYDSIEWHER